MTTYHRHQMITHTLGLLGLLLLLWIWLGKRHTLTEASYAMGNLHVAFFWGGGKWSLQMNDYLHFPDLDPSIISDVGLLTHSWAIDPASVHLLSVPPLRIEQGPPSTVFLITIAQWFIILIYLAIWPIGYLLWQRRTRS